MHPHGTYKKIICIDVVHNQNAANDQKVTQKTQTKNKIDNK